MKPNWYFCAVASAIGVAALGVGQTAQAQTIDSGLLYGLGGDLFGHNRNVSVLSRPHPEYQPLGIPVGSFLLSPSLDTAVSEVDNVYAVGSPRQADTIGSIAPAATLASQWANNAVEAHVTSEFDRYAKFTSEDTNDYDVGGSGHLDVSRSIQAFGSVDYGNHTEPRSSSSNYLFSVDPATYKLLTASTGIGAVFDRLRVIVQGDVNKYDYKDLYTATGDLIDQRSRNDTAYDIVARADYAFSPAASIFVQGSGNKDDFVTDTRPGAQPNRTSSGYNSDLGIAFEPAAPFRGSLAFGYQHQSFQQSAFYPVLEGLHVEAKVEWFPTTLTTVTLNGYRTLEATGIIGVGGGIVSHVGLQIDHELLRNLILTATASYEAQDLPSATADIVDHYKYFGLSGVYSLNRHVRVSLSYNYVGANSNGAPGGIDFNMNMVRLGLGYHY